MKARVSIPGWSVWVGLLVCSCGGDKPAQSAADADTDSAQPAAVASAPPEPSAAKDTADQKTAPAVEEGPKPTRSAEDIITAPDVVYLFSFNDSEPKQAAEEKCSKKAGDDAKKMNECMAAARKNFPADGHRFKKDEKDQWWWITVRQTGNRLTNLHRIPVEFAAQTETSVTLKPVGKDTGSKPMVPPAEVVFEVPNDYQIATKDPKHGRLVFQAKVGVVAD